jgi:hypothetical protein
VLRAAAPSSGNVAAATAAAWAGRLPLRVKRGDMIGGVAARGLGLGVCGVPAPFRLRGVCELAVEGSSSPAAVAEAAGVVLSGVED